MGLLISEVSLQVCIRTLCMLLLVFASLGVFVPEDEVQFIVLSTFVRAKHDCIWSFVMELIL